MGQIKARRRICGSAFTDLFRDPSVVNVRYGSAAKDLQRTWRRPGMKKIRIASMQLAVAEDKYENIERLAELVAGGVADGADMISLPEMWNCPYRTDAFPLNAEPEGGDSWLALSTIARKNHVYVVGGSIPELGEDGKIYNTCYVFGRNGEQIGKHRKVHLFDIYAHGEQLFKESDTLTGGDSFTTFETEWCRMAVNICFDIRFPESSRLPALDGAKVIFNPASFNMTTGPAHWEIAFRQRAVENQVYMIGTAAAASPDAEYQGWGHSIITDPWGRVLMQMEREPCCELTEIDLDYVDEVRQRLPLLSARREDVYVACRQRFRDLVARNRSVRGFDPSVKIPESELLEMIDCARLSASSQNIQPLKFRIVSDPGEAALMHGLVKYGRRLPELDLPFRGTEPPVYILICQDLEVNDNVRMFLKDVGIADAAITLAAAEMGYGACIIGNFSPEKVQAALKLPERYAVMQVIALGRSAEDIRLVEICEGDPTDYYRDENNVHYVPKRKLEDILIGF